MKRFPVILFSLVCFLSSAQDIKLKKGDILVDGTSWLHYDGCGAFSSTCSLQLLSDKEEVIYMNFVRVAGVEPISNYNKTGDLTYVDVKFLGLNATIEIKDTFKKVIEIIYNSKCINEDGTLNEEKVLRLTEKFGTPFSDRLRPTQNTTNTNTIIIRDEPRRSGVNINIGR